MSSGRLAILTVALVGLAISVWVARPADPANIVGWIYSVAWPSAAWAALCVFLVCGFPIAWGTGAVVALTVFELFFLSRGAYTDALFLAVKPFYQVPVGFLGAAAGAYIAHLGRANA